jgi:hypothetical protein
MLSFTTSLFACVAFLIAAAIVKKYITAKVKCVNALRTFGIMSYFVNFNFQSIKARERSLSEKEVEEFFNGYPDLVDPTGVVSSELLDFLPYDKEYEINLEDVTIGK